MTRFFHIGWREQALFPLLCELWRFTLLLLGGSLPASEFPHTHVLLCHGVLSEDSRVLSWILCSVLHTSCPGLRGLPTLPSQLKETAGLSLVLLPPSPPLPPEASNPCRQHGSRGTSLPGCFQVCAILCWLMANVQTSLLHISCPVILLVKHGRLYSKGNHQ